MAKGELQVRPGLPPDLAQGVFARPGATYPAVVRFSNGSSSLRPDAKRDARGMAVKLFGVPGEKVLADERDATTQDFVMISHPVFAAGTVKSYLRLQKVLLDANGSRLRLALGTLTGGSLLPWRWYFSDAVRGARLTFHPGATPSSITYFSMSPIRYGEYVAKYRVIPTDLSQPEKLSRRLRSDPDGMRESLAETLRAKEVALQLQVQLRTSDAMPVEDATVMWSEKESPFETVADLRLFRQEVDTPARRAAEESLSFSVWHAIPEHEPLGGINRVRKEVYRANVAWRHGQNGVTGSEPSRPDDIG